MADLYPYITENQTLGINELAQYVNVVSDNLFFPLLLLALFVIFTVISMPIGMARAFTFSSFFCSILAIFLVIGNYLNPMYMYLLFVMLAGSMMLLRLSKSSTLPQI